MSDKSIESRIFKRLNAYLQAGETVVIAVSGGVDSLALLHIMAALADRLGVHLHVATLDHGLRREQGADDARYVERVARSLGIACTRGQADVRALAATWNMGIETAARRARYDFLAEVAAGVGATRVLTAHHADDQAETVLMRIVRGTGIEGLGGMAFESPLPEHAAFSILRPLLDTPKADLIAYCSERGIIPREDATNAIADTMRNRIRNQIMPLLRALNPQVERALTQLADIAQVENAALDGMLSESVRAGDVIADSASVAIAQTAYQALSAALRRRFLIWAARRVNPNIEMSHERVVAAVAMLARHLHGRDHVGAALFLGADVRVRVDYSRFVIERGDALPDEAIPLLSAGLSSAAWVWQATPTYQMISMHHGWTLYCADMPPSDDAAAQMVIALHVPLNARLALRQRIDGDVICPVRLKGRSRKISRWMIDVKIPEAIRARVPILTIDAQIAAILWQPAPQIDLAFSPHTERPANRWLWFAHSDDDVEISI
jgi:tRNA(Ile)-lysidine synthetase-like protein